MTKKPQHHPDHPPDMPPKPSPAAAGLWPWFRDRVLPPLFIALTIGGASAAWSINVNVSALTNRMQELERDLAQLRSDQASQKAATVTRAELLETMKRVEQQLEIMMLRAGLRPAHVARPG